METIKAIETNKKLAKIHTRKRLRKSLPLTNIHTNVEIELESLNTAHWSRGGKVMIDLTKCDPKDLLTMRRAAELMPRLRKDRPVTAATVWRWATYGLQGVRLETIVIGGVRCTSRAALQEFCEAERQRSTLALRG
jgi:hypothetical protein